jgi:hypothetical protein
LAFQYMPHLFTNNLSGIVFEYLWNYFHLEDSISGFPQLFHLCSHIAHGHIPRQIAHIRGAICLLTMIKPWGGVCPITMGEALYWPTNHTLCLQFHDAFATHFSLHQFAITIKGRCEAMIHRIKCTWDIHPNLVVLELDMVNVFNSMLKGVIFQKICATCGTSYNLSLSFVHFMHLNLTYFIVIVIVKVKSWSSHLSWEPVKMIPWEGHYLL